jgi:hypothetical protein
VNGRIAVVTIVLASLLAAFGVWYANERANFDPIPVSSPSAVMRMVSIATHEPEVLAVDGFEGIEGDSSPLRFRGCFRVELSLALLTETYEIYEGATPLIAPSRFACFDAQQIGQDLEAGEAVAFLSEREVHKDVDRVIAVYPDGRAYAWQQLNESASK